MNVREGQKRVYVGITGGKLSLSQKTDANTKFAVEHHYKDAAGAIKSTWKVFLWSITGMIKDVKLTKSESNGKEFEQLEIHIKGDEDYVLQTDPTNKYAADFFRRARGIDYSQPCFINSYDWEEKNKRGIVIKQELKPDGDPNNGKDWMKTIGNYYWDEKAEKWTDEVPKPEGDPKEFDKDDWKIYYTKLTKFYKSTVEKFIQPMIKAANPMEQEPQTNEPAPNEVEGPKDDLPF